MTHLSRPYQIALAVIVLMAAVWLVALRGHSSPSATGSPTPASQPAAPAGQPAPSTPYQGSAPGVAGLTRAIEKARGAVAQSEANAKQLAEKSAQASSPSAPSSTSSPSGTRGGSAAPAHTLSTTHAARTHAATGAHVQSPHRGAAPRGVRSSSAPAQQQTVEAALKHGKVVAILFWNPHAVVDQAVQRELQAVARVLSGQIAVMNAHANQVGAFGPFSRAVQVYGTPTILIVNRHGQTTSLTGLTDVYSLEQAIGEARR
jgi:hypothetical protein